MTPADPDPSREELLAMAYADGELDAAARAELETLLPSRPDLVLEVARHRELAVLARAMAPPEPADYEWRRLDLDPLHRGGLYVGYALVAIGGLGLCAWLAYAVYASELDLVPKVLLECLLFGLLVLLGVALRARLRTLPFDPYERVQR